MFFNAYAAARTGCPYLSSLTYLQQPWSRCLKNSLSTSSRSTSNPAPLKLLEPSPEYLSATLVSTPPGRKIDVSKKLVILELNGVRTSKGVPRPYWQTFKDYLFHEDTRSWLDTMVWSCAKPTKVADVVKSSFGQTAPMLLAVWARHKMKVDPDSQNQSPRLKDLHSVWKFTGEPKCIPHSSYTTLLIDQSYDAARLQPYNHILVPERDLRHPVEASDDILLCAVGILEAARGQENVAHWIRHGGLMLGKDINEADEQARMWWVDPKVREHWRDSGKVVLRDLKIEIRPKSRHTSALSPTL
ncbi:hypothetical protein C0991_002803 [Blastosporella zonata]|nr:hypothetical protein C0991_002803 [Blastosporella zonata]